MPPVFPQSITSSVDRILALLLQRAKPNIYVAAWVKNVGEKSSFEYGASLHFCCFNPQKKSRPEEHLRTILKWLTCSLPEAVLQEILNETDADGSGTISQREYLRSLRTFRVDRIQRTIEIWDWMGLELDCVKKLWNDQWVYGMLMLKHVEMMLGFQT